MLAWELLKATTGFPLGFDGTNTQPGHCKVSKSLLGNSQEGNMQCSRGTDCAQVDIGWTCFTLFVGINPLLFGECAASRCLTKCI